MDFRSGKILEKVNLFDCKMKSRSYKNMAYGKFLKNFSFVHKLSDFTPVFA